MSDKVIQLSDFGEIPLVTIGDSAFPQYTWPLKMYNEIIKRKIAKLQMRNSRIISTKGFVDQEKLQKRIQDIKG